MADGRKSINFTHSYSARKETMHEMETDSTFSAKSCNREKRVNMDGHRTSSVRQIYGRRSCRIRRAIDMKNYAKSLDEQRTRSRSSRRKRGVNARTMSREEERKCEVIIIDEESQCPAPQQIDPEVICVDDDIDDTSHKQGDCELIIVDDDITSPVEIRKCDLLNADPDVSNQSFEQGRWEVISIDDDSTNPSRVQSDFEDADIDIETTYPSQNIEASYTPPYTAEVANSPSYVVDYSPTYDVQYSPTYNSIYSPTNAVDGSYSPPYEVEARYSLGNDVRTTSTSIYDMETTSSPPDNMQTTLQPGNDVDGSDIDVEICFPPYEISDEDEAKDDLKTTDELKKCEVININDDTSCSSSEESSDSEESEDKKKMNRISSCDSDLEAATIKVKKLFKRRLEMRNSNATNAKIKKYKRRLETNSDSEKSEKEEKATKILSCDSDSEESEEEEKTTKISSSDSDSEDSDVDVEGYTSSEESSDAEDGDVDTDHESGDDNSEPPPSPGGARCCHHAGKSSLHNHDESQPGTSSQSTLIIIQGELPRRQIRPRFSRLWPDWELEREYEEGTFSADTIDGYNSDAFSATESMSAYSYKSDHSSSPFDAGPEYWKFHDMDYKDLIKNSGGVYNCLVPNGTLRNNVETVVSPSSENFSENIKIKDQEESSTTKSRDFSGLFQYNIGSDIHESQNCLPLYTNNRTDGVLRPITKNFINNTKGTSNKHNLPHTVTSGVEWANAPEFIPQGSKPKSYAEVVHPKSEELVGESSKTSLCPYIQRAGVCQQLPECQYLHGEICEYCRCAALHPTDSLQRKAHHQKCMAHHEKQMELSFAVARSQEKTCGICFEIVWEKQLHERRFGILAKCNHCFCLTCIRKWRKAREFEHKVVKACPECRITSDFVCPSSYWVDTADDKEKLISNYKKVLAVKPCKYFRQGNGKCPFGNKCFYLHALPNGIKTDVGPPTRRRRHRNRHREERDLTDTLHQLFLLDFLEEPEHHFLYSISDDIEELVAFFSDSDESEWSDYEFLVD